MGLRRHAWPLRALCAGTALAVLAGAGLPAAQGEAQPASPAQVLARWDSQIAEIERQLAEEPDHPTAWGGLILVRLFREAAVAGMRGGKRSEDEARNHALALHDEWIDAQPWNPHAYIGKSNILPPSERADYLTQMIERISDRPEAYEQALWALRQSGEAERADRLADQLVLRNRQVSEAHRVAYRHFDILGHRARANEILDGWLGALPGDAQALELLWSRETRAGGETENRALVERIVDRLEPSEGAPRLCSRVGDAHGGAWADLAVHCYEKLLDAGPPAEERTLLEEGLAVARSRAAPSGDPAARLAGLPPDQRERALLSLAGQRAQDGDCAAAVELVESPAISGTTAFGLLGVFSACVGDPTFEPRLMAVATRLDADTFANLLMAWPEDRDLEAIEAQALRRLDRDPDRNDIWQALDRAYRQTGRTAKRVELLRARIDANPRDSYRIGQLADLLTEDGRVDEAVTLLENLTRSGPQANNSWLLEKLALYYLGLDRTDEAAATAERIVALEGPDTRSPRGDLMRARVAAQRGDLETAYDAYRGHLLRDRDVRRVALGEITWVAAELDRLHELPRLLERRYEHFSERPTADRPTGGLDSWVAGELETVSLLEPALVYLDRAIATEPGRADLRERKAKITAWLGRREEAREARLALVEIDPGSVEHWAGLAESHLRDGRPDLARQVTDEGVARLGWEEPRLRVLTARAYLEEERAVEAIRVLATIQKTHPDHRGMKFELLRAYQLLGKQAEARERQESGQPSGGP